MLPSPSVPGSWARLDDVGVLPFHREILEEVAAAGLASFVFDPRPLSCCILPKKSFSARKSGAGA